jgi:hypothetical protein
MKVSREQVLAYRTVAQGLLRESTEVGDLAVLDLGVQEAMGQPAAAAFDARLPAPQPGDAPLSNVFGPGQPLALVWSLRGAPHVHRRAELNALAGALFPLSEADAAGRLNETGPSVAKSGIAALEQYRLAVAAMADVVTGPTAKGAASTAVTRQLPDVLGRDCRACKTRHVSDSAMRVSALAAGLELEPGTAPPVLLPRKGARRPAKPNRSMLAAMIRAYLTLLGPATQADVAGYLGTRRADLDAYWPEDLVEVMVEGRKTHLPSGAAGALAAARQPELVRLLGGFDPILQARDRDLIVPDTALQKALWPVLGRPGALFVDGAVVGTWRPKTAGAKLTLSVEAFVPLPASTWKQVEVEAERVAGLRGAKSVTVVRR